MAATDTVDTLNLPPMVGGDAWQRLRGQSFKGDVCAGQVLLLGAWNVVPDVKI